MAILRVNVLKRLKPILGGGILQCQMSLRIIVNQCEIAAQSKPYHRKFVYIKKL